jgi:hypothetical protein
VKIPIPAPPELEEATGYEGDGRLVIFCWSPCSDDAICDDRRSSGTDNWDGFLALVNHQAVKAHLGELRHARGSSDENATHWLLLDRQERRLSLLESGQAARLLDEQRLEGEVPYARICREGASLAATGTCCKTWSSNLRPSRMVTRIRTSPAWAH